MKSINKVFFSIISLSIFALLLSLTNTADAYVSVKGYYKSNGTYVSPHVRSNPNGLKSDNYSYTPSQGAYNKTYGTRGAEWDTPTYITDPSYYQGKSLYESGNSNSGTYYQYPTTPTCPINSYYDGVSSCKCNYGYIVSGGSCVNANNYCSSQLGVMSQYNSLSNKCECMSGYEQSGSTCVYKIRDYSNSSGYSSMPSYNCPLNSHTSPTEPTKCDCDSGYQVNSSKTACVLLNNNVNNQACINSYGAHSNWDGTKTPTGLINCVCQAGYTWNNSKSACVAIIPQPQYQNDELIGKNYYLNNRTCVGLSDNQYSYCISYAYNH